MAETTWSDERCLEVYEKTTGDTEWESSEYDAIVSEVRRVKLAPDLEAAEVVLEDYTWCQRRAIARAIRRFK